MKAIRRRLARQPFSGGVALAILVVGLVTGPIFGPPSEVQLLFGTGFESVVDNGHWWSPITSAFLADNGAELLLAIAAAILVLGYAERLMGTLRTVVAFALTAIVGTGLGVLGQSLGVATGEMWSRGVSELGTLDAFVPIAGSIMAASFYAGPLWRRRIRVFTLATVLVLVLYSGQPSDLYRLIAALAGLGLGALFRPKRIVFTWTRSSHHESRTLLSAVVGVVSIGPLITILSGGRFGLLAPLGMLFTQEAATSGDTLDRCLVGDITRECVRELTLARLSGAGPALVSLLPLLALLVAAIGMARGRRLAAWIAIVINAGLTLLGALYYGLLPTFGQPMIWRPNSNRYWEVALTFVISALVPLVISIVVAMNLRRFTVRGRPGLRRVFAVTTVSSFVGLAAIYVGVGWMLRDRFTPVVSALDLLLDVPERFIPIGFLRLERPVFLPADPASDLLYHGVGPLFWAIFILTTIVCMRGSTFGVITDDRTRLDALLAAGGGGSLAYMSTWDGNSLWFNASRTTAIAYRVVNGVAITTTEPIGPAEETETAIAQFAVSCDDHGWIPVFYSFHDDLKPIFDRMGWQSMGVGEETVLRPRTWSTTGKKWQDIRSSINRADRGGVRADWTTYRSLPPRMTAQIEEISEQWVQEKELPELGFTLGGLDELRDPAVRLMLAVDADDRIQAVTSWLPSYRRGVVIGWTLDFMRRSPDSMNGVMEFVIAQTAELMSENPEIEFLSLSAAPLAQSAEPDDRDTSLTGRLLAFIGRTLEPVYGFQSLLAFKRKFQPEFHPMYMAFPDPVALPTIGMALARAYLPTLSVREAVGFARSLGGQQPAAAPKTKDRRPSLA